MERDYNGDGTGYSSVTSEAGGGTAAMTANTEWLTFDGTQVAYTGTTDYTVHSDVTTQAAQNVLIRLQATLNDDYWAA